MSLNIGNIIQTVNSCFIDVYTRDLSRGQLVLGMPRRCRSAEPFEQESASRIVWCFGIRANNTPGLMIVVGLEGSGHEKAALLKRFEEEANLRKLDVVVVPFSEDRLPKAAELGDSVVFGFEQGTEKFNLWILQTRGF